MAGKSVQKVLEAAKRLFLRYGYKRVTMADIAEAADMSRPALYLVFPSKEEIFSALLTDVFATTLDEIRQGLRALATTREKLVFAFEVWAVRPFEMTLASPDAKDLFESSYEFATEVTTTATAGFVAIVAEILEPLVDRQTSVDLSSMQIAQMLTCAMPGFKGSAPSTEKLRELISALVTVALASLGALEKPRKHPKKIAKPR